VLALARQMGYFDLLKEGNEVSPVEEKPGVIGMIVPSLHDQFVYEITPFLQKAFASIGVGFSVITKDPDDRRYNRLIGAFRKFYSGLILVGEAADDYTIRSLRSTGYPFVLLEKCVRMLRLNTVCTDMSEGSQRVADHIEKLGYKNVLTVTYANSLINDRVIIDMLRDALGRKTGINKPINVELDNQIISSDIDFTQLEKYMRPPHSADVMIILHSDLVYRIMAFLRKKNLRVPQDIALISMEEGIGFDLMFTPVTSLRKPFSAMALKIVNMIWSKVRNSGKGRYKRQVNMSPELVVRNSCSTI
jgi:LacI family transcriptional regulator